LLLVDWVKDAFLFQSDAVLTSLLVVAFGKQASYLSPPAMGCLKCQHRTIASHLARVDTAQGREATGKRGHTACNRDPLIAQLVSFLVVRVGHAAGHGERRRWVGQLLKAVVSWSIFWMACAFGHGTLMPVGLQARWRELAVLLAMGWSPTSTVTGAYPCCGRR
jgi:hypothetical protein